MDQADLMQPQQPATNGSKVSGKENHMIKVHRDQEETLCRSCRSSRVILTGNGEEKIFCRYIEREVNAVVVECSSYDDASLPSEYEMKKIAWYYDPPTKEKPIGFIKPSDPEHKQMRKQDPFED